jgi:acid phosphatase family membrane protein YuiD
MDPFKQFFQNHIFWVTASSWIIAQTIKVIVGVIREKRFNFRWFVGTGGMPSSHAAGVASLATSVGITYGFDSPIFAITLVFTLVVLFDAQGVRRSSGAQAAILNKMLDDLYWKKRMDNERLKELMGHTPVEVFAGIGLGILIALAYYYK